MRWLSGFLMLLTACSPQATPFPVVTATEPPPSPVNTAPAAIRYALHMNAQGYVEELDTIMAAAEVEQLTQPINPDDLGGRYDIVAGYGDWAGWTRSPVIPHAALIVNTRAAPLDIPAVAEIARRSPDPDAIVAALAVPGALAAVVETTDPAVLRTEMANLGHPDGLAITLANMYTPGINQLTAQLRAAGLDNTVLLMSNREVNQAFDDGWLHLALVAWTTPEARAAWTARVGEANVIDLYTLPISYRAVPGVTIIVSPGGWPIAGR